MKSGRQILRRRDIHGNRDDPVTIIDHLDEQWNKPKKEIILDQSTHFKTTRKMERFKN